jgi:hypothetical protein
MIATEQKFEVLPKQKYLFQVVNWEDATGKYGPQVKITLEVLKPSAFAGKQRCVWPNKKLTSNPKNKKRSSKLWRWTEAIYNRPLVQGEEVDFDSFIGRKVVADVDIETGDNGEYNTYEPEPFEKQEPFPVGGTAPAKSEDFEVGPEEDKDPFGEE